MRDAGLEGVEVREHTICDAAQLKAFVQSELPDNEQGLTCRRGFVSEEALGQIVQSLTGKVWSAKIYAQKPGG